MKRRLLVVTATAVKIQISAPTSKETALRAFPKTRGECEEGIRPCPYRTCRYHLWDQFDFPRVDTLSTPSCALDVADDGAQPAKTLARWFGMTRQAVENIERRAIKKVKLRGG